MAALSSSAPADRRSLPDLLLAELTAYLHRRKLLSSPPHRKQQSNSAAQEFNHNAALKERLHMLRFVYGLSSGTQMTTEQLDHLWSQCSVHVDREALMLFLASASNAEIGGPTLSQQADGGGGGAPMSSHGAPMDAPAAAAGEQQLHAAFSTEVCIHVFENLFCAENVGWEYLGEEAYRSFQMFFESLRRRGGGRVGAALAAVDRALDALWRICLTAGNGNLAVQAMTDLLSVYSSAESDEMESFSKKIFDCLVKVKEGLLAGNASSERSAERCIRILNAAIDQCGSLGGSASATAERIASLPSTTSVDDFLNQVPHGMRGHSARRIISVMANRISQQGNPGTNSSPTRDEVFSNSDSVGEQSSRGARCERFSLEVHPLETLASIKVKIAAYCNHDVEMVKPSNVTGRPGSFPGRFSGPEASRLNLNVVPDTSLVADLGITDGCEMVVLLANKSYTAVAGVPSGKVPHQKISKLDLSELLSGDGSNGSSDRFFETLISVLESLPATKEGVDESSRCNNPVDTHSLVWDLLLAMPTNAVMIDTVREAAAKDRSLNTESGTQSDRVQDDMIVDSINEKSDWSSLIDATHFERSVYVMQVIDSYLQPTPEIFSSLPRNTSDALVAQMRKDSDFFREDFIKSGGFDVVLRLFIKSGESDKKCRRRSRMGNACALRILTFCFIGNNCIESVALPATFKCEQRLIESLTSPGDFLKSLIGMIVHDEGVADAAILRALKLVRLMLASDPRMTSSFVALPGVMAETFLTSLLLREGSGSLAATTVQSGLKIRRNTEDLILAIPLLSTSALPWLVKALIDIDPSSDGSSEFFSVLMKLVTSVNQTEKTDQFKDLGTAVCNKLASYPRPNGDNAHIDYSTGVLCVCLKLLVALIDSNDDGGFLVNGSAQLVATLKIVPWSQELFAQTVQVDETNNTSLTSHPSDSGLDVDDKALIDLIGSIFDGFLSSSHSPGLTPICCDKESRQVAFDVVAAAARACNEGVGYKILVTKIEGIISSVSPAIRHCWGQHASPDEGSNSRTTHTVKYSGLRNQGCTCYMNSVLQQLFMMPGLRKNLCSALLPSKFRSSGGGAVAKGSALVGKKISLHWDCGNNYDAMVDKFDEETGMHTITYCPVQIAAPGPGVGHPHHQHQVQQLPDVSALPTDLPDELILSEGRPGKETGAFEILSNSVMDGSAIAGESSQEGTKSNVSVGVEVKESDDEASSRRLLEEVQRTFVNLDEARGRCFDPRSLVEASNCLKLEFDVWQQNDASEFAMKLLDRLEISLKRWSPTHFKYLTHTFGLKQTKQKICKECGLKTNREENLMNIDCQIRGNADIQEALSTMCEDEIMEGDNKVLCDRCKKKTDTVLRTAISALPDVLVLSLKRFDLDYNTFETVKLNSRCAFGEALNMKRYTLEGTEALEAAASEEKNESGSKMDVVDSNAETEPDIDPLGALPDEDFEYRLAGVLVHAGVAQGGHYYSFIKDRTSNKWYRFDDEDVTPFDPSLIEQECFGGKVKKETKFPNGHVHTVESEQFANALMLFYEKVKPVDFDVEKEEKKEKSDGSPMEEDPDDAANLEFSSGNDVFLPDVRRSNATHSWQSFLLSPEFQIFAKEMLELCIESEDKAKEQDSMDISSPVSPPSPIVLGCEGDVWRLGIVKMSLSYVFDVLFHMSLDRDSLRDWTAKFMQIFSSCSDATSAFVIDLAKRTHKVNGNWIRAYSVECQGESSRRSALQIISNAIHSFAACTDHPAERVQLQNWIHCWRTQVNERERDMANKRQHVSAMPVRLESGQALEDLANLGAVATSIGIIISFISMLLEICPRYVQSNVDLCFFIRELASSSKLPEGQLLREALIEAQFPARLTSLAMREKSLGALKLAFPGASVGFDVADAVSKNETAASSNLLHLPGSGMGNPGLNGGNPYVPTAFGNLVLLEALGCLLNMPWVKREIIISDTGESSNRGRAIVVLSQPAVKAFTVVFEESKPSNSNGMNKRDIQHYMKRCGIDNVPSQRIESILNKHSSLDDGDGNSRLLDLGGFLAYYRDAAQNSDFQVRSELNTFGFRPDLTRRDEKTRWYVDESSGRKRPYTPAESIVRDVASSRKNLCRVGKLAEYGMLSLHLLNLACNTSEPLAEYLLAACALGRDTTKLMFDTLNAFHKISGSWGGTELLNACVMVFKVLAAIPDERQQERLTLLMISNDKMNSGPLGLMIYGEDVARRFANEYHYSNCIDRYIDLIRELQRQRAVAAWMLDNRPHWAWMEPEVRPDSMQRQQSRGDYSGRRDGGITQHSHMPLTHPNNSDSDVNAAMNDSDDENLDDDDESRYDSGNTSVNFIEVKGCGVDVINGEFKRVGNCDNVPKYSKENCPYEGKKEDFMLFRCKLSDETKRWYISIVPGNIHPGTTNDVDFYVAPSDGLGTLPPKSGWKALANKGLEPPPQIVIRQVDLPDGNDGQGDSDVVFETDSGAAGYL